MIIKGKGSLIIFLSLLPMWAIAEVGPLSAATAPSPQANLSALMLNALDAVDTIAVVPKKNNVLSASTFISPPFTKMVLQPMMEPYHRVAITAKTLTDFMRPHVKAKKSVVLFKPLMAVSDMPTLSPSLVVRPAMSPAFLPVLASASKTSPSFLVNASVVRGMPAATVNLPAIPSIKPLDVISALPVLVNTSLPVTAMTERLVALPKPMISANSKLLAAQTRLISPALTPSQQLEEALLDVKHENASLQRRLSQINQQLSLALMAEKTMQQGITALKRQNSDLQASLSQLQQQLVPAMTVEQQLKQQLTDLKQQNGALQRRLHQLNQQVMGLREHVAQLRRPVVSAIPNRPANEATLLDKSKTTTTHQDTWVLKTMDHFLDNPALLFQIGIGLFAGGILLFIWALWPRRRLMQQESSLIDPSNNAGEVEIEKEDATDLNAEYDFMASEDAIPVKLDLARAYLGMGNFEAAQQALEAVLEKGTLSQQQEAEKLLQQANLLETA